MSLIRNYSLILFTLVLLCLTFNNAIAYNEEDKTSPAAPTGVSVSLPTDPTDGGIVTINWSMNKEEDLEGYYVIYSLSPDITPDEYDGYTYVEAYTTSYTFTELTNDLTYYFIVTAYDEEWNESESSIIVSAMPKDNKAPSKPIGISAQATSVEGQLIVNWTANTESDLYWYKIYWHTETSISKITYIGIDATVNCTYYLQGLYGLPYYIIITAIDKSGNEGDASNYISATPKDITAPDTPIAFISKWSGYNNTLEVNWNRDLEIDVRGCTIYVTTDINEKTKHINEWINCDMISYSVDEIDINDPLEIEVPENGLEYWFGIKIYDYNGNSSVSKAGNPATAYSINAKPVWPISSTDEGYKKINGTFGEIHSGGDEISTKDDHYHCAIDIDVTLWNSPVSSLQDGIVLYNPTRLSSKEKTEYYYQWKIEIKHNYENGDTNKYNRITKYLHLEDPRENIWEKK